MLEKSSTQACSSATRTGRSTSTRTSLVSRSASKTPHPTGRGFYRRRQGGRLPAGSLARDSRAGRAGNGTPAGVDHDRDRRLPEDGRGAEVARRRVRLGRLEFPGATSRSSWIPTGTGYRSERAAEPGRARRSRGPSTLGSAGPRPAASERAARFRHPRVLGDQRLARRRSASPVAASTSITGTTPRAAFSVVASASVPTVSGASSTAHEVTATARPLPAPPARPERDRQRQAHREQVAEPDPEQRETGQRLPGPRRRPQHREARGGHGEREREQPRRVVPAREPAAEHAPGQHAAEVAGHQRDRGVR